MKIEVKVPSPGESITEVEIASWLKKDGDYVMKDEEIAEIDSDKATLSIAAEESGELKILVKEGEVVAVGTAICSIDTDAKAPAEKKESKKAVTAEKSGDKKTSDKEETESAKSESSEASKKEAGSGNGKSSSDAEVKEEKSNVADDKKSAGGFRISKQDALENLKKGGATNGKVSGKEAAGKTKSRDTGRKKMSMLRKKISQRLVSVKNETAMLTTFNEADMSAIMAVRSKYKERFKEQHGVGLGFMSFFTKAVTESLMLVPGVNSMIDGEEIISHDYADIGIAVSAPKGLMVPVIRNAESLSFAEIEKEIAALAAKAREGKLSIEEMSGGTFTISNGGVFGSMMSTPILNPPQSAILGMHNIVERPVAINGKVEIRPMMYLAVSYDHRIIDGSESVTFLVNVKNRIENPMRLLFGEVEPEEVLLGL